MRLVFLVFAAADVVEVGVREEFGGRGTEVGVELEHLLKEALEVWVFEIKVADGSLFWYVLAHSL